MPAAAVPLLYLLTLVLWIATGAALPDFHVAPVSFFLAPILYLAAGRIRDSLARFEVRDAAAPIAQVILGTFLIGGLFHVLEPRTGAPGGGIALSLLLGLALSLGEPICAIEGPRGASGSGPARPAKTLAQHVLLTILLGAVAASVLGKFIEAPSGRSGPGRELLVALLDLAKGLAAGAGVGLAGWAALRAFRGGLPRSIIHIALAEASVFAATLLGSGSVPLAALAAGFLGRAGADRRTGPSGPASSRESPEVEGFPGAELIHFIGGAGILIIATGRLDPARIGAAAPAGAALWLGSVVLRFLVHFGFGGLRRLGRPGEIPQRWLPAIAWASHPGPTALGLYLAAVASGGMGTSRNSALLVAVLLALLIQGATAGAVLARADRGPPTAAARERWMKLIARGIALRAERREVGELEARGWLDGSAAVAMREAIRAAERRLEQEEEETLAGEPRLVAEELTRAARRILDAGRQAVADARESGQVDAEAAREIELELVRLRLRTDSAPLAELLGGGGEAGHREPADGGDHQPSPRA